MPGTQRIGVFRYRRGAGVSKLLATGDPLPQPLGGTIINPERLHVAEDWAIVQVQVSNGAAPVALVRLDLKTNALAVVAMAGKPTGTAAGGTFAPGSQFASNIHLGTRADGNVFFSTTLVNALNLDGFPAEKGLFSWDPRSGLRVVALDGQRSSNGTRQAGVSSFILNDRGRILYFIAREDPL